LNAGQNVFVNAPMTASGTGSFAASYGHVLDANGNPTATPTSGANANGTPYGLYLGQASGVFLGRIDVSGTGTVTLNQQAYTVITTQAGLDAVNGNPSGNYVLGGDLANLAPSDVAPFGYPAAGTFNKFTGNFNGLGHSLTLAPTGA